MKKNIMILSVAALAISMVSCKTNQNAYKAAYEKAKEKEIVKETITEPEALEIVEVKRTQTTTTPSPVRVESVTGVTESDAAGLKRWNIVVGSFKNKTNAEGLKQQMIDAGYPAILAQNAQGMYRVIVASYNDRDTAVEKKDEIRAKYAPRFNDIWLLDNQ
ncbi:MAG: SPOR domain-containing protein [Bacteroidales bacterium]